MIYEVCVLFDKALGAYSRPMFVVSKGQAVRAVTDEANSRESDIGKHPSDYELFYVGKFDDRDASFDCDGKLELVCRCVDLVKEGA